MTVPATVPPGLEKIARQIRDAQVPLPEDSRRREGSGTA